MPDTISVALISLGRVGHQFAASLAKHIEQGDKSIEITAVAEQDPDSETPKKFAADGVPVYTDAAEVAALGEKIGIIFDLTGVPAVRQTLRESLRNTDNRHTVIVPEVFVRLLWSFLGDGAVLSGPVRSGY